MIKKKPLCSKEIIEMSKLPTDSESLAVDFQRYLTHHLGRFVGCVPHYLYEAFSLTVRDHIMADWCKTWKKNEEKGVRRAYYIAALRD